MRRTELIMGMPVTVVIPDREQLDRKAQQGVRFPTLEAAAGAVFESFRVVDGRFSPYKESSETSRIDRGELAPEEANDESRPFSSGSFTSIHAGSPCQAPTSAVSTSGIRGPLCHYRVCHGRTGHPVPGRRSRCGRLHGRFQRNGHAHTGMMRHIDSFLDRLTIYRLTLYYLIALAGLGFALSLFGLVPARPEAIACTTAILFASCHGANAIFSRIWRVRSNPESSLITALILVLILEPVFPPASPRGALVIALAGAVGMASKYLLAIRRQHLFNPAAAAALFSGLVFGSFASWWVGGTYLLPLVMVGGALLARKVSRFCLVGVFLAEFLVIMTALSLINGLGPDMILQSTLFVLGQSAVVFFAVVMLTEPMTSPKRFSLQALYAGVVALLYQPQLAILGHNLTPEQALMAGNLLSYIVSPSYKIRLALKEQRRIGSEIVSFTFVKPAWFRHRPGQYMEWSLPLQKTDSRGTRRYFSLASSPTEEEIMVAARFPAPASRFKQALLRSAPGSLLTAGELAGDFTLPRNPRKPLAFVAGGIGITPFRSMLKYLSDRGEKRDIVLLFSSSREDQVAFQDVLEEATQKVGLKATITLTDMANIRAGWTGKRGMIDAAMIRDVIPDASRRLFLVSGPPGMVNSAKAALRSAGVHRSSIRTDYFPGYLSSEETGRQTASRRIDSRLQGPPSIIDPGTKDGSDAGIERTGS